MATLMCLGLPTSPGRSHDLKYPLLSLLSWNSVLKGMHDACGRARYTDTHN